MSGTTTITSPGSGTAVSTSGGKTTITTASPSGDGVSTTVSKTTAETKSNTGLWIFLGFFILVVIILLILVVVYGTGKHGKHTAGVSPAPLTTPGQTTKTK